MRISDGDFPGFSGVGRTTRAITYSLLGNEVDLTLLELNLFSGLSEASASRNENGKNTGDILDGFYLTPGVGQAIVSLDSFYSTMKALEEKGLLKVSAAPACQMFANEPNRKPVDIALTKKGIDLMHSMAGNLSKALATLDHPDVRASLDEYQSVD